MATLLRPFKWLFQTLWRLLNFTRQLILNLVFFALVILLVLAFRQNSDVKAPVQTGALLLNLSGQLVEQENIINPSSKLVQQMTGNEKQRETEVGDVVYAIGQAKLDPTIRGLVLQLDDLAQSNLSKLQQVAAALDDFRKSGKKVIAVGNYFQQHQYLIAAHADSILLDPAGAVMIQGFGQYNLYFKAALDKFNITPQVFRVGTYKSFVEPYIRDDMSPEAKEANRRWMSQMWQAYVQDISQARKIPADAVSPTKEQLLARLKAAHGNAAEYALAQKLVDKLATREERIKQIAQFAGSANNNEGFHFVSFNDYLQNLPPQYPAGKDDKVALVVASGTIMNGQQSPGAIGGDSLSLLLRQVLKHKDIKALVLRIDSPGGSAFAAEQIRSELQAIQAEGKPIVVSMGSLAASGGYWMAAGANKIIAEPTTLTGSIGVFGMFATVDKALNNLGVHADGLGTTDFTDLSPVRPMPEHMRQIVQLNIENTYQRFIELVAKGRHMTPEAVDKVAQGRVWSAADAKQLGLVDQIGTQQDAIRIAAELAKLPRYQVKPIEPELSQTELIIKRLLDKTARILAPELTTQLSQWLGLSQTLLGPIQQLNDPAGQYALAPVTAP